MIVLKRNGCTRNVFLVWKYAVKIPTFKSYKLFLTGILANLQEKLLSPIHDDLAKVRFCSPFGLLVVMDRAEEVVTDDWLGFKEMVEARYKDDIMAKFMLSDVKPCNFGFIKGKLVKIDYGN